MQQTAGSLQIAESGIEEALLRLVRDPEYVGGTLSVGEGLATITIIGETQKTITSVGELNGLTRTIQVQTDYNENVLTVLSWEEIN